MDDLIEKIIAEYKQDNTEALDGDEVDNLLKIYN